jgi:hypothetical protein
MRLGALIQGTHTNKVNGNVSKSESFNFVLKNSGGYA